VSKLHISRAFVSSLVFVSALAASTAAAEVARIQTGPNSFGQGWLYLDQDGRCKILTAGHVVARNGVPVASLVYDRRGRQLETGAPEVFSKSPDVAVLPVKVPAGAEGCSRSRLSQIGIDRRVTSMVDSVIETTGRSETVIVPVERAASRIDSAGGEIFSIRPRGADRVMQGWSGSVVRDQQGPLGVVFSVDGTSNEAFAVRVDVLNRLKRQEVSKQKASSRFTQVAVSLGETIDPAAGPGGVLDARRPPWRVKPVGRRISIVITADRAQTFQRVIVSQAIEEKAAISAVEIEAGLRPQDQDFISLRTCAVENPVSTISCAFLEQSRSIVRVSMRIISDGPVAIRSIQLD